MVTTLIVGVVLTSLPSPGPPPRTGAPLVRAVMLNEASTGVLVVPQRPGRNLVLLMTDRYTEVKVDGRTYQPKASALSEGYWVSVDLPAGRTRLEVRQGRQVVQQVLDLGSEPSPAAFGGADELECAAAALGALLGGSVEPLTSCPSQSLSERDAGALRALVANLAGRKVTSVRLVGDRTPRSVAADKVITDAARKAGIKVSTKDRSDAVIATAGWETAHAALSERAHSTPATFGVYLAPWLLQASIVAATGTSPLSPLWFDPDSEAVVGYLLALRRVAPQQSATSAGLAAYLAARAARGLPDADPGTTVRLYAATSGFEIMPMQNADGTPMKHGGTRIVWLPKGSLTPVSKPLTD
jgi:hypothetical protein